MWRLWYASCLLGQQEGIVIIEASLTATYEDPTLKV